MKIDVLTPDSLMPQLNDSNTAKKSDNVSFSEFLNKSISDVNNLQFAADSAIKEIAAGKMDNIQDAVMAVEKANISMSLLLEVKNKAIQAYNQIMNMQV